MDKLMELTSKLQLAINETVGAQKRLAMTEGEANRLASIHLKGIPEYAALSLLEARKDLETAMINQRSLMQDLERQKEQIQP